MYMYICVYIYIHVYMHTYIYIYVYIYSYTNMFLNIYISDTKCWGLAPCRRPCSQRWPWPRGAARPRGGAAPLPAWNQFEFRYRNLNDIFVQIWLDPWLNGWIEENWRDNWQLAGKLPTTVRIGGWPLRGPGPRWARLRRKGLHGWAVYVLQSSHVNEVSQIRSSAMAPVAVTVQGLLVNKDTHRP